jgi:hypothetical protein
VRGQGGLKTSGEFRHTVRCSLDPKPKNPSFMDKNPRFGSIGWGIQREVAPLTNKHNHSINYTETARNLPDSSLLFSKLVEKSSNPIISQDRFHIRKYDNSYSTIGTCGFLNMSGNFAGHVDKTLHMQSKPFFNMNMSYQRKYVKDLAQSFSSNPASKGFGHNSSTHNKSVDKTIYKKGKFPNISEWINNNGKCNFYIFHLPAFE